MTKKEIIGNIVWLVCVAAVLIAVRQFIFTPVLVSGHSMDPTMADRERVFALRSKDIERFDIVTFPAPDEPKKSYIKRVIGLPGDKVKFVNDQLFINGKEIKEPYLDEFKSKLKEGEYLTTVLDQEGKIHSEFALENLFDGNDTVPEGKLFVMGDNRQISKDGRMIGYIDIEDITGNVKFSFWPPSKFGKVE
ncbi:signal peptidase I [Vagococcus fessus]|uniref:Signal peptidase I n=1 Tax=Vagococcus fessus TaxID=120370 RepID=A0A430ADH5_9ENTE|nr:signal peptidase I [Vagococcus fessus]RSU05265.1 signal peptidase I [Vagococcus fessus]